MVGNPYRQTRWRRPVAREPEHCDKRVDHNWRRTRVHSPISPRGVVCSATDMAMGKLSIYPPTGETRPRGLYFSSSRRRRVMAWAWPSPCAIIPSPAFSTECPSKPRFLPRRQLADLIYPQPLSHAVSAVNLQQVCAGLCCRKPMQGRSNGCSLGSFAPQASRGTTQGLLRPPVPSARSWLMRVEMSPISAVPAAPLTGSTLMPSSVDGVAPAPGSLRLSPTAHTISALLLLPRSLYARSAREWCRGASHARGLPVGPTLPNPSSRRPRNSPLPAGWRVLSALWWRGRHPSCPQGLTRGLL